jgi:hypothetical protein
MLRSPPQADILKDAAWKEQPVPSLTHCEDFA